MSDTEISETPSSLLSDRNFRWLFSGGVISLLGDQFTMIAFPWLVLKLTGDPLIMGTILVTIGVPRVFLLLIGGALVDRYSAKTVLMASHCLNGGLLALLAISAFTGHLNMSLLYSVAFGIGIATAFSFPSVSAIVAQAMTPKQLPVANSIMMGATQIVSFSGPLLAGILIAALSHGGDAGLKEAKGFGAAFLVDFASFVFSIWALSCVRIHAKPAATIEHPNVWQSVAEGLRYFWRGGSLRTLSLYTVTIALLVLGPLQVALPVLAEQMGNGAAGFGILTSSFGAGAIIGTLFFSLKPHFRVRNIGTTILLIDSTIGVLLILIGQISVIWQGAMLLFAIGILAGFLQVMVHSWMQQRVPLSMLGRVMSVFVFMMLGAPLISITISGWLLRTMPAKMLYVGSGMLLLATVLIAGMISSMRTITDFRPSSVNGRSQ